jgi:uncharacterized protein YdaU (DUF1376 family)
VNRPYVCLYISEMLGHENVWALDDIGFAFYVRMLLRAWKSDEAYKLPNNDEDLMIAASCKDPELWAPRKKVLMRNFKVSKDGAWLINGRLKEEYEKMVKNHRRRQVAGKKGGIAKAKASNATAMPQQSLATQTQTQTQTHKEQNQEPIASSPLAIQLQHFIALPLNDNSEYLVTVEYLKELKALYPAVDVPQQLRNMLGWLKSKPDRRKTKRGVNAFIHRWLSKAQDEAPSRNGNGQVTKAQRNEDSSRDAIKEALARRSAGRMAGDSDGGNARALPEPGTDTGHGAGLLDGLDATGEAVRPEIIPAGARSGTNGVRVLPIRRGDSEGD